MAVWTALLGATVLAAVVAGGFLARSARRSDPDSPAVPRRRARPDVVLISIDSLRADHLGTYGYRRPTSPRIDALARDGVAFEHAVSTTSWTLPAHVSMLTGLFAEGHGVRADGRRIPETVPLLAEILRKEGYRTGGVVAGPYLARAFGFARGFELYDDATLSFASERESHHGSTSPLTHQRAIETLDRLEGDQPLFLFVHYWDVHYDYSPPAPFDTMFDPGYGGTVTGADYYHSGEVHAGMDPRDLEHVRALYDGEIAYTDGFVGRLFDELKKRGRWDDALVIVTADHGDEFFEHGSKGHRNNLYDSTLRVPLVVRFPRGWKSGTRVPGTVGLVDLVPTILETAGVAVPQGLHGTSLRPRVARAGDGTLPPRSSRTYYADLQGAQKAVVRDGFKFVAFKADPPRRELYDLLADPDERADMGTRRPEIARSFDDILMAWVLRTEAGQPNPAREFEYEKELADSLRSLGYLQ